MDSEKDIYSELLKTFHITMPVSGTIDTFTQITLDNIHNAILKVGVDMKEPCKCYVNAAKQNAIDESKTDARRHAIINENVEILIKDTIDEYNINEYNFTPDEIILVNGKLDGKTIRGKKVDGKTVDKIDVPIRKYRQLLDSIQHKILYT